MTSQKHAVIVGAGIGGLATATGLHNNGWRVTVVERAPAFGNVGSGISLYPNSYKAFEVLGLSESFAKVNKPKIGFAFRNIQGDWLKQLDHDQVRALWGAEVIGFHRADLHEFLRGSLPEEAFHMGVTVDAVEEGADGRWMVRGSHGFEVTDADLVVGSDGIESRVRTLLWPDHPGSVYTGKTCWRGVTPKPADLEPLIVQVLDTHQEFGFLELTNGMIYWFAAAIAPENTRDDDPKAAVLARYAGWDERILDLIRSTDRIVHNDIRALPSAPASLVHGRAVLLGDAAHAMSPHLGQGGGAAIEGAAVLVAELKRTPDDIAAALARYDAERQPRIKRFLEITQGMQADDRAATPESNAVLTRFLAEAEPATIYQNSIWASSWRPPALDSAA